MTMENQPFEHVYIYIYPIKVVTYMYIPQKNGEHKIRSSLPQE